MGRLTGGRRSWPFAVAIAAATAVPGTPVLASGPRAQASRGAVCGWSGRDRITPGLTTIPREITFSFTGNVGPCRMSDGSTRSGREAGSGNGTASCSGGDGSYVETITWNDGTTSTLTAGFVFAAGVAIATGRITDGEWAGTPIRDVEFVTPDDPSACASAAGMTGASYQGVLTFGGS